ncbi:response regulator transcription factor [Brenneria populi subsp. brevivirga]|uniref:response regulator transcription factor n=1 Tax=Brenneria populi TaxID=1505588 RepID=UPI002E174D4A|nr:response regulator transcription factor [Brenneria populi subsp. brevivirga]
MSDTPETAKILVVDDHRKIRDPLATYLQRQHFSVITAESAASLWSMLRANTFNLIILDVLLPDGDGIQLCHQIQRYYKTPVILLTACDTLDDRVTGLESGADDYITKPFEPRELLARIHTVLRRIERHSAENIEKPHRQPQRAHFSGLLFNPASRIVSLATDHRQTVRLSTSESKLLSAFIAHPYRVLSREMLMDQCVTPGNEIFDRGIDRQISRLRLKLHQLLPGKVLLDTVWGEGYRFTSDVKAAPPCDG